MMTIDLGQMFCAVSPIEEEMSEASKQRGELLWPPCSKGFLNRFTGEIVFLCESEIADANWHGEDVAVENVGNRAAIEASPDQWLEIPRCYDGEEEPFIRGFLAVHGIQAELA